MVEVSRPKVRLAQLVSCTFVLVIGRLLGNVMYMFDLLSTCSRQ